MNLSLPSESHKTILECLNLSTGYGSIPVLKQINLIIKTNELVSLVGANGAGKTTFMKAVTGLIPLSSGEVKFNGITINKIPAFKRPELGIALVPEGRQIFPRLTVKENLELGGYCRAGIPDLDRYYQLFPILGERQNQLGGTLSGGEQQMLAIARALMSNPKLLMLDEPSMGVAPLIVEKIFETLVKLKMRGLTIFLVEQNAKAALSISDRSFIIDQGTIALEGKGPELLNDDRIKELYLGC